MFKKNFNLLCFVALLFACERTKEPHLKLAIEVHEDILQLEKLVKHRLDSLQNAPLDSISQEKLIALTQEWNEWQSNLIEVPHTEESEHTHSHAHHHHGNHSQAIQLTPEQLHAVQVQLLSELENIFEELSAL